MKITLKVFGTIFAIVALLASAGGTFRNFRDAKDMDEIENTRAQFNEMNQAVSDLGVENSELGDTFNDLESTMNGLPTKGQFTSAGIATAVLGVLSIVLVVFQFVNRRKPATIVFVLTLIVAIAAIFISPVLPETLTSGASNRTIAIFAAVPAMLAGLTAFLVARMSKAPVVAA